MSKKRVVITGMGIVSPIGNNINQFWNNLKEGYNGIDNISLFDTTKFDVKIAGEVDIDFNAYFDRKELNKLDRFSAFARSSNKNKYEESWRRIAMLLH